VVAAALRRARSLGTRRAPAQPKRILIAHHQLLGDTLLMTALVARIRERWPGAEIFMTMSPAFVALYQKRPYGLIALPYDPRDARTVRDLLRHGPFDLALIPGDNRDSWLAMALGAKWIVAFAGDRPATKNWLVDEFVRYGESPATWADMLTALVGGGAPAAYRPADWPSPDAAPFELPRRPYVVLHIGAGNTLRLWQPEKWRALAAELSKRGMAVAWSAGKGQEALVAAADPEHRHKSYAGALDLPQLWRLLADAAMLVSLDTGIAHMGRLAGAPTVTLFGQGTDVLFGAGEFWKDSPYLGVIVPDVPCRDQHTLFRREIAWVRRCQRGPSQCARAVCMEGIGLRRVLEAVERLGAGAGRAAL
jgi:ADP-heptose:LPS heptosyltransferase